MSTLNETPLSSQDEGEDDPASHSAGAESLKQLQPLRWKT